MSGKNSKLENNLINFAVFVFVIFVAQSARFFFRNHGLTHAEATIAYLAAGVAIFVIYLLGKELFSRYYKTLINLKVVRLWLAASASWLLVLLGYYIIEDPFGRYVNSREVIVALKVILIPIVLILLISLLFHIALKKTD